MFLATMIDCRREVAIVRLDMTGAVISVPANLLPDIPGRVLCRIRPRNIGAGLPVRLTGSAFGSIEG
jgi:hypothetical protein